VAQLKWGGAVSNTPVRTLTLSGGHPTDLFAVAFPFLPGISDGVATVASQVASTNNPNAWPPAIRIKKASIYKNFDLGVFGPPLTLSVNIGGSSFGFSVKFSSVALNNPLRATHWWAHQILTPRGLLSPGVAPPMFHDAFFSSAAVPYLSPSGMLLSNVAFYADFGIPPYPITASPWNRAPNHFSFIQSASDHFVGTHNAFKLHEFYFQDYYPTPGPAMVGWEANREESFAVTDPGIYAPYGPDGVPLLRLQNRPRVVERIRGVRIDYTLKLGKKKRIRRTKWVWMRRYHLLKEWEGKMQFDYVYESILRD
jgi:hypothetical protein